MERNGEGYNFLTCKIKEGIFVGLQIRELMNDKVFERSLNETEAAAWNLF